MTELSIRPPEPRSLATASATARSTADNVRRERIWSANYTAINKAFPHIRHDPEFYDLICTEVESLRARDHALTRTDAPKLLKEILTTYQTGNSRDNIVYNAMLEMLPAYEAMAKEAAIDAGRTRSRSKWHQDGDCFARMVADARNTAFRESYAFGGNSHTLQ